MAAKVLTLDAAKKANIGLVEETGRGDHAVHELITAYRANRRSGSANTKTRGEVSATGKKPFRQKGTGNARQGGNASPINRGGGVVFGPRPRSYAKKLPRAVKRLAFRKALTERIRAEDVIAIDDFEIADGRTKSFVTTLKAITDVPRTIVVGDSFEDSTYQAGRNLAATLIMTAHEVNAEHLLYFDKIVVTKNAMEILAARTAV